MRSRIIALGLVAAAAAAVSVSATEKRETDIQKVPIAVTAIVANGTEWLPSGLTITPLAAPGSSFLPLNVDLPVVGKKVAGSGVTSVLSSDGHTLLVLTSGFNGWVGPDGKPVLAASTEHLFSYDVSSGTPVATQDVPVPNAYGGMALTKDGRTLYLAGGSDDVVRVYRADDKGHWAEDGAPIALNHQAGNGIIKNPLILKPMAAGAALTADERELVVANYENDSIAVISTADRKVVSDLDLRPGKIDPKQVGVPGGEFPYWVAIKGSDTAYVSSQRDREVDVVALSPTPHVTARIAVPGNPNRLLLDRAQERLFVAADNSDRVLVIDTATNAITASTPIGAPDGDVKLPGASPNSLALSPDEKNLYVTESGINALAIVSLDDVPHLVGLVPTAWQPNSVSVSNDGKMLYVVNGKSVAGPPSAMCAYAATKTPLCGELQMKHVTNDYVLQNETGGVTTIPVPDPNMLQSLTALVAKNDGFGEMESADDAAVMEALRKHIKHVIYIVRENRTYDQILGDLGDPRADGDPSRVQFGEAITTNAHALAKQFVDLDSFFDSGEVSGNGWQWSTAARTTDNTEKEIPVQYAERGASYDTEGTTRDINVSLPTAERAKQNPAADKDPDLLPGPRNQAAPDGPDGEEEQGYLWDAALRAHKDIRNYGFFLDIVRYDPHEPAQYRIPPERDAFAKNLVVAIPANRDIAPATDLYFRGFDNEFPDLYRFREWNREFTAYEKSGKLPALETVRFMHDHTGDFKTAIDGVNTPETQVADNDYAVGLLVDRVAHSKFANSTLVFVIEDDAQDGPDHVAAHRSIAFVAGPYVKQGAVVSDHYTTVNMLRTIEEVLSLKPLNFHDANARPMATVFDLKAAHWTYNAKVPPMLRSTQLPLPPEKKADARPVHPLHDAAYWAAKTKGMDFSSEDRVDPAIYNRILWTGTNGNVPYPATRDGKSRRVQSGAR